MRPPLYRLAVTLTLSTILSVAFTQEPTVRVLSISVEQSELYEELETAFNEAYPEWTVQIETISQDAFQQTFPLSIESGSAPDVLLRPGFATSTLNVLLENNWVAPVAGDQEVPQAWFDRFPEGAFVDGHNMVDGVVYGVPLNEQDIWGHGYLYYNREVLRAADVDPETEIPTTWSELLAVCERVKASGSSCFTASLMEDQIERWWIPFTSVAQAANQFNLQEGHFAYADPARLRAWDLLKTLYDNEYFIPGVESTDRDTSRQVFALGQAAFYVDGAWIPSVLRTGMGFPDLDFGVAPIPVPDDGVRGKLAKGLLFPDLWVTSQVRNPEAAWAFVDWLTQPEGPYAQGYVGGGFGFLNFTDNTKWIDPDDEVLQSLISIATDDYRAFEPQPVLACSDVAQSTALQDALYDTSLPTEYASLVEDLVSGQDWTQTATRLAEGRQRLFEANLEKEQASGLDVRLDYFTYPEWEFGTDFDYSVYPLCEQ